MFGFQKVRLNIKQSHVHKMIDLSKLKNFKMTLSGRQFSDSLINLLLESEQETLEEIYADLETQFQNLQLYVNLYSNNSVHITKSDSPETFATQEYLEERILHSLDELTDEKIHGYLKKHAPQQYVLLQIALKELDGNDMFNAFPKLINWLDDNDGKGSSRFCSLRDSCDHGILDKHRAIKNVNEMFPGEFEFEDDTLKRDSPKNLESLKNHLPEVLEHIKRVFKTKYIT